MPNIVQYLGSNDFLVGNYPTWIDFYLFEFIQFLIQVSDGAFLKDFEAFAGYNQRIKGLKNLKEYLNDPNCPEALKDFNGPIAKVNGKLGF